MKNYLFCSKLFTSIIAAVLLSSLALSSTHSPIVYATTSLGQSIQQSQQDLQSTINDQVQQSITDTINNIDNDNSDSNNETGGHVHNITNTSNKVISGGVTSLQNDALDNNTTWIVGGVYRVENASSDSPIFNASFYMVKTDGNASHSHEIYDLILNSPSIKTENNNSNHLNGTTTVTMKNGSVTNVPTNITLLGDTAISIWLDPSKVNNHFGNTPIYGTQSLKCVESPDYCNLS